MCSILGALALWSPCRTHASAKQLAKETLLVLGGALGLVDAALGLKRPVAGNGTGRVLQPALRLIGGALDAILVGSGLSHVSRFPAITSGQYLIWGPPAGHPFRRRLADAMSLVG